MKGKMKPMIDLEEVKNLLIEIEDFGVRTVVKLVDIRDPNNYMIKIGHYVRHSGSEERILPIKGMDYSVMYEPLCELVDRLRDDSNRLNKIKIEIYLEEWRDIPEWYGQEVDEFKPSRSGFLSEMKLTPEEFPTPEEMGKLTYRASGRMSIRNGITPTSPPKYIVTEIILRLENSFDIDGVLNDFLKKDEPQPKPKSRIKKFFDFF